MLIMLKEVVKNNTGYNEMMDELVDRTINPKQVKTVSSSKTEGQSKIEFVDGTQIIVVGNVKEITHKLNETKKLLKG